MNSYPCVTIIHNTQKTVENDHTAYSRAPRHHHASTTTAPGKIPSCVPRAMVLGVFPIIPLAYVRELAGTVCADTIVVQPTDFVSSRHGPHPPWPLPQLGLSDPLFLSRATQLPVERNVHSPPRPYCQWRPFSLCTLCRSLIVCLEDCQQMAHKSRSAVQVMFRHCCHVAAETLDPSDEIVHWFLPRLRDLKAWQDHKLLRVHFGGSWVQRGMGA